MTAKIIVDKLPASIADNNWYSGDPHEVSNHHGATEESRNSQVDLAGVASDQIPALSQQDIYK